MSADPLRILFLGTGDIARPAFSALLADPSIEVVGLVTQPDRPAGRHQVPTPPEIKLDAQAAGCPVFQPERVGEALEDLTCLDPHGLIVMAYGQFLPRGIRELPRYFCWNLHASLLPKHRGASPLQAAILHGDAESGVSVMEVVREMDAGAVICAESLKLSSDETGQSLHNRIAELAPLALVRALSLWRSNSVQPEPQDPDRVTWAPKLSRVDGELDASRTALELESRIRAFHSWPGTYLVMPDRSHLKVFPPVEVVAGCHHAPGTIFSEDRAVHFATAGGTSLRFAKVQPPGRRMMDAADFLRGHRL